MEPPRTVGGSNSEIDGGGDTLTRLRPRQVRYQAALRPDICCFLDLNHFLNFRYRPACPNRPKTPSTVAKP